MCDAVIFFDAEVLLGTEKSIIKTGTA